MKNSECVTMCVFSPKGGVGKTTLSMFLAATAAKKGLKVLLIDFDLFNGGLSLLINEPITKTIYQLTDDLNNNRYKSFDNYVHKYNQNIDILCAPKDPRQGNKIDAKYIDIIFEKASLEYNLVIIDTSSVLDEINLITLDKVKKIIFVAKNDMLTLKNLRNILNIFKDLKIDNYKVLLNSAFDFSNQYFSIHEIKKIIGANIDYVFENNFFIKDITSYIYENKIPILEPNIYKRYKTNVAKLDLIVNELFIKEDKNEEK